VKRLSRPYCERGNGAIGIGRPMSDIPTAPQGPEFVEKIVPGRFEGKTAIVTGAGSGIGKAVRSASQKKEAESSPPTGRWTGWRS